MTRSTNQRLLRCVVVLALLACVRLVRAQNLPVSTAEITTFSDPSADTGLFQGTTTLSVNEDGVTAEYHADAQFMNQSHLRDKRSLITTFDVPNAKYVTFAYSINDEGAVAGYYSDASGFPHGIVRNKHGNFTEIDTL